VVGEAIVRRREEMGLSQYELAKRAGVGQGHLSKIEAGEFRFPSPKTRQKVGAVLGWSEEDWFRAAGVLPNVAQNGHAGGFDAYEGEFVGWLRSQPRMRAELDEVRATRGEEVYRKYLAALWSAWESNFRATMAALRLGEGGDVT
jgi:transcriptional regulator with XRE-family HTH domain